MHGRTQSSQAKNTRPLVIARPVFLTCMEIRSYLIDKERDNSHMGLDG
jgi:hypothetical protein